MSRPISILLVSGSLRHGSVNGAALHTAVDVAPDGLTPVLYEGMGSLPHFNPDDDVDPLPPAVAHLRAAIGAADAVLFCVPEYAGALPGSFKNLLDWTVGGGEIYEKPVAWINAAATGRGVLAHESLRTVLGYTGSRIVDEACVSIPVDRATIGGDGLINDPGVRTEIAGVLRILSDFVSA
jgi:NAD(P)H-dependent FMN reductase